jgi:M6 family metalloprotease-like protein
MTVFARYFRAFIVVMAVLVTMTASLKAAPAHPDIYDPATMRLYATGERIPLNFSDPNPLLDSEFYRGSWLFPVIFVETPDVPHTYPVTEWEQQLFTIGTFPTGSMRDYYRETSNNLFDVDGVVMGWITLNHDYDYYHQNNYGFGGGAAEMAREAVEKADLQYNIDWSQFDNTGDGNVEGVLIIHMGIGGESSGSPQDIWSHVSAFAPLELDGVTLSRYSIQPELRRNGLMETIGTICHEHGHVLGLPDLYDVSYTSKPAPVGRYCLMASGCNAGNPFGSSPAHLSVWGKYQLGWVTPTVITEPGDFTIDSIQTHTANNAYKYQIPGSVEFFIMENRWMEAPLQFDAFPARFLGGLMVYHIDDNMSWSNDGRDDFWRIKVVDATPDTQGDLADAGFSAATKTIFGRFTDPNTDGNYHPSGLTVLNVSPRGEQMSFSVNLEPVLQLHDYDIRTLGNNRFSLQVTLKNITPIPAHNLNMVIASAAENVTFENGTASLGTVNPNETATSEPFIFQTTGSQSSFASFTVNATGDTYQGNNISFHVPVNPARILLVDDDHTKGAQQDLDVYWQEALDNMPFDYQVWNVWENDLPFLSMLKLYDLVIWCDGILTNAVPKEDGALDLIADFLDSGGDLIWSSQEFLYSQYQYPAYQETAPGDFAREYLRILVVEQDEFFYDGSGVTGTITEGMNLRFEDVYSQSPDINDFLWWPDEFIVDDSAIPILLAGDREFPPDAPDSWKEDPSQLQNAACAMLYQGQYRLMFMSVGLHGISLDPAHHPNTRQEFLGRVLEWFGITDHSPGLDIDTNQAIYEVGDTCHVSLKIFNPAHPTDIQLFIGMEAYGQWFFGPNWTQEIGYYPMSMASSERLFVDVFPPFEWPQNAGEGTVTFWAVMLNAANGQMVGNFDFTPLSWQ